MESCTQVGEPCEELVELSLESCDEESSHKCIEKKTNHAKRQSRRRVQKSSSKKIIRYSKSELLSIRSKCKLSPGLDPTFIDCDGWWNVLFWYDHVMGTALQQELNGKPTTELILNSQRKSFGSGCQGAIQSSETNKKRRRSRPEHAKHSKFESEAIAEANEPAWVDAVHAEEFDFSAHHGLEEMKRQFNLEADAELEKTDKPVPSVPILESDYDNQKFDLDKFLSQFEQQSPQQHGFLLNSNEQSRFSKLFQQSNEYDENRNLSDAPNRNLGSLKTLLLGEDQEPVVLSASDLEPEKSPEPESESCEDMAAFNNFLNTLNLDGDRPASPEVNRIRSPGPDLFTDYDFSNPSLNQFRPIANSFPQPETHYSYNSETPSDVYHTNFTPANYENMDTFQLSSGNMRPSHTIAQVNLLHSILPGLRSKSAMNDSPHRLQPILSQYIAPRQTNAAVLRPPYPGNFRMGAQLCPQVRMMTPRAIQAQMYFNQRLLAANMAAFQQLQMYQKNAAKQSSPINNPLPSKPSGYQLFAAGDRPPDDENLPI